ncbi:MAG: exopolysaccharide biosynthesis polyprenyl glycosylphosphotransferase [Opitutaceae bacterium]|nr:exopolysaccharide biosynthesis polyprenyl glycosylphosphotransferase [Opitutaceae bacterium]
MNSARRHALLLFLLDGASLVLAFNVLAWLRGISPAGHWLLLPLAGPLAFLTIAIYLVDGYKERTDMLSLDYTSLHTIAVAAATVATLLLTFAVIPAHYPLQGSRLVILLGFIVTLPLTLGCRRFLHLRWLRRHRLRHLLYIGPRSSCESFRSECAHHAFDRKVIFAIAGESPGAPSLPNTLEVRPIEECLTAIKKGEIDVEAIVVPDASFELPPELSDSLLGLYFSGVPTYTVELFHQLYWRKIPLMQLSQAWLFRDGFQMAREPVFVRLKRLFDILVSAIGLVLAAPIIVLCALAIRLSDGAPAFFRQRRVGKNRSRFVLVKLRTMRPPTAGAPPLSDEERITPVGRFLRGTRLDELPQLWNVLRGEMSLIGPRAEWEELVNSYERQIPCYHFRHLVKPGITGWAQVNHPYGVTVENTVRKLEYDLYYIRHFSFVLDASILLKTVHIMLFGKGR